MKHTIIDERGRLFGKISVIDIFVILVAIAVVAAAYMKFTVLDSTSVSVKTVPVTYELLAKNVRQSVPGHLRRGDDVYTNEGLYMGKVVSVITDASTSASILMDGSYTIAPVEERVDVWITLDAQCSVSDGRYYVNRTFELNVNAEVKMQSKYSYITANIIQISGGHE
jgi:hypothetical protein